MNSEWDPRDPGFWSVNEDEPGWGAVFLVTLLVIALLAIGFVLAVLGAPEGAAWPS